MAAEVERKFLVAEAPELGDGTSIEQGYLAVAADGTEVRLRRAGDDLVLTIKRGGGIEREELELDLPAERFEDLWPLTEGARLAKTRHKVPLDGHIVEVDVYGGDLEPLVVAEIEFGDEAEARDFEPPSWFGEEITGNEKYANAHLATKGRPR